jgi:hypothetical protein
VHRSFAIRCVAVATLVSFVSSCGPRAGSKPPGSGSGSGVVTPGRALALDDSKPGPDDAAVRRQGRGAGGRSVDVAADPADRRRRGQGDPRSGVADRRQARRHAGVRAARSVAAAAAHRQDDQGHVPGAEPAGGAAAGDQRRRQAADAPALRARGRRAAGAAAAADVLAGDGGGDVAGRRGERGAGQADADAAGPVALARHQDDHLRSDGAVPPGDDLHGRDRQGHQERDRQRAGRRQDVHVHDADAAGRDQLARRRAAAARRADVRALRSADRSSRGAGDDQDHRPPARPTRRGCSPPTRSPSTRRSRAWSTRPRPPSRTAGGWRSPRPRRSPRTPTSR